MYVLAAGFLMLSGASGLIYEISWARLLSPHVGSDNAAISIVLSSFFLGMALGSYLSSYLSSHSLSGLQQTRLKTIKIYIVLELIIGLSALSLLPIIANLSSFIEVYPYFAATLAGKLILAFVILMVPTICLGATFPIVSSLIIEQKNEIGLRLGQLYFYNTLGAVVGCLVAGFLLIPDFGLDGAVYVAMSLNFFIVAIAWFSRKKFVEHTNQALAPIAIQKENQKENHSSYLALFSLTISGFVFLACEVAWTKYLAILTISSMQSFAVILACTLTGIAAGSWFIRHRIATINNPVKYICVCFLLTAFLLMTIRWCLNALPFIMSEINSLHISLASKQQLRYGLVAILLFPVTFMFGVLFPVALSLYSNNIHDFKKRMAFAYSMNTLTGILGALVAGFWLLPSYGTDTVLLSMIMLLLVIPLYFISFKAVGLQRPVLIICLVSIITISFASKGMNYERLITAVDYRYKFQSVENKKPEFLYLKEGENTVVSLVKYDEKFAYLQNNGLQESMIALDPNANGLIFETMQAYIPYFLHDNPKSAFVVGYGGGITSQALADTELDSIKIVEIEKNIVEAVKQIPQGPALTLEDKRVSLSIGDARTALLTSQDKYDIITSQPSHPWVSGAANLFTREFFQLINSRLTENGISSQWMALFGMDVLTFKAILKAFYEVFPYGFTMENKVSGDMMLIGAKKPLIFDYQQIGQRMLQPRIKDNLKKFQISDPSGLLWFFTLSRDEIMASTKASVINTDMNIYSETHLSSIYANGVGNQDPYFYINTTAKYDLLSFLKPEEVKYQLFEMGKNFLDWNGPAKSFFIAAQLEKVDPVWGKSLTHEILYWKYDYQQATALYNSQSEWLDISHYRQFQIALKEKLWSHCVEYMEKIQSETLKRLSRAMLLYEQENWSSLLALSPQTNLEKSWQLMAKIKQNDLNALPQLASMTEVKFDNIKQLQLLADSYRHINATQQAKLYDDQIKVIINARLNFYAGLTQTARLINNPKWAEALNEEIERLNIY